MSELKIPDMLGQSFGLRRNDKNKVNWIIVAQTFLSVNNEIKN